MPEISDEEYAQLQKLKDDEAAKAHYGGAAPVGGGSPPGPRESTDDQFVHDFEQRWNENGVADGRGVTKREIDRYVQLRVGANMIRHLADNSRIPAVRTALAQFKSK